MDIKFHIKKMITSGGDVYDWLDFINQLKRQHIDRDLLLEIHKVAMKNVPNQPSVGYKKLMIGLANLLSEVSTEEARDMFVDAMLLDPGCAVVRVYHAQFEYLHQQKSKARQILLNAKLSGSTPKSILRIANQNLRENKVSLFDGVNDPWSITQKSNSGESQSKKKSYSSSSLLGSKTDDKSAAQSCFGLSINFGEGADGIQNKGKMLPPPTRKLNKCKSESSVGNTGLNLITPQGKGITSTSVHNSSGKSVSDANTPSLGVTGITSSSSEEKTGNTALNSHERRGPTMSPFMLCKYSPLIKKRDLDMDFSNDDGVFSDKRKPFSKPSVQPFSLINQLNSENSGSLSGPKTLSSDKADEETSMKKTISPLPLAQPTVDSRSKSPKVQNSVVVSDPIQDAVIENLRMMDIKSGDSKKNTFPVVSSLNTAASVVEDSAVSTNDIVIRSSTSTSSVYGSCTSSQNHSLMKTNNSIHSSLNFKSNTTLSNKVSTSSTKETISTSKTSEGNLSSFDKVSSVQESKSCVFKPTQFTPHVDTLPPKKDISRDFDKPLPRKEPIDRALQPLNTNTVRPQQAQNPTPSQGNEMHPTSTAPHTEEQHGRLVEGKENMATPCVKNASVDAIGANVVDKVGATPTADLFGVAAGCVPVAESNKRTMYTVKGVCYYQKNVLGRGGSSKVYDVLSQDGQSYALKRVKMNDVDNAKEMHDSYRNEIKWLEKLRGNNYIIRLFNWEIVNNSILMVLEKGEHDLSHILKSKALTKDDIKDYWRQIINAVNEIHKVGIVHTDLKPANFLLVGKMLKLIDFGIANCIQDNKTSVTRNCQMGTLNYMSPEALTQDHCRISRASDVWSLGCILYYMVYRKTPYSDIKNQYSRFFAVQQGKPICYNGLTDLYLVDCLQGCLKHDRKERYTIEQLLKHPYLN